MSVAGRLGLRVAVEQGQVRQVRVENSRPLAASLLNGRRLDEAVALASALFSLCGRAQGLAARLAVDAARGRTPAEALSRRRAVMVELAQEHLWRLMIDWPEWLGEPARRAAFADLHRSLAGAVEAPERASAGLRALLAEAGLDGVRTGAVDDVLVACRAGGALGGLLARLIEQAPRAAQAPSLLPGIGAATWSARLPGGMPDEAFCRQPGYEGAPAETGALARCAAAPAVAALVADGRTCAARVVARVIELGDVAERLLAPSGGFAADAASGAPGVGLSCVETARGLLMHAVRIDGGTVADYRIVAPTEWNFHPGGVFAREALGLRASRGEAVLAQVRCLALSLDPCVTWDVLGTEGEGVVRA